MKLILLIDILGTISFAISGVLTALNKRLDPFGILIIAFVTAVGGGTLRDVLIDVPVAWMRNLTFVYVIVASAIFAVIFRKEIYATACILGASAYFLLQETPIAEDFIVIISGSIVITVRLLAVYFKLSLPSIYRENEL